MNPLYGIIQQQMAQYHNEQMNNICDCVRNLKDLLQSMSKVAPEYHQECLKYLMATFTEDMVKKSNFIV